MDIKPTIIAGSLMLMGGMGTWAAAEEWQAPADAAAVANPIAPTRDAIIAGEGVYRQSCSICHGAEGNGDGQGAAFLVPKPASFSVAGFQKQSDGAMFWKILTGRNAMPGFKTMLTDTQRWELVDYMRTLARKPAQHAAP